MKNKYEKLLYDFARHMENNKRDIKEIKWSINVFELLKALYAIDPKKYENEMKK